MVWVLGRADMGSHPPGGGGVAVGRAPTLRASAKEMAGARVSIEARRGSRSPPAAPLYIPSSKRGMECCGVGWGGGEGGAVGGGRWGVGGGRWAEGGLSEGSRELHTCHQFALCLPRTRHPGLPVPAKPDEKIFGWPAARWPELRPDHSPASCALRPAPSALRPATCVLRQNRNGPRRRRGRRRVVRGRWWVVGEWVVGGFGFRSRSTSPLATPNCRVYPYLNLSKNLKIRGPQPSPRATSRHLAPPRPAPPHHRATCC
jgi:hypothetical protein